MPTKSNNTGGRGGKRPGAGRKKTAVREKYENGNPGGRKLEVLDIPDTQGVDMPEPHEFLSARQHDGSTLSAAEIYRETWEWLDGLGVAKAVSPQLLERYAMCSARWIQCEEMTTKLGYLSKHPTTGNGRVSANAEYSPGVTSIPLIETSTSDDLTAWTDWISVGTGGALQSPSKAYIRYRVTLATTNTARTPVLTAINLYDNPKPLYSQLGYARPVILDSSGNAEAVLDNAYDIIVTSEINGIDTLEFKLPFRDGKREYVANEKQVRIVSDTYRIRTVTDDKDESGKAITSVYAEAAFYDLSFSVKKEETEFTADTADVPMAYALQGTDWEVGTVNVSTKRTWTSTEDNALSILRRVQSLHGGDLIFDNANKVVNLLTFSGTDSGALFCYRKNMKSIQRVIDTTSLITRLYAVGADGMTFVISKHIATST